MARSNGQSGGVFAWVILIALASVAWQWARETAISLWGWVTQNSVGVILGVGVMLFIFVWSSKSNRRAAALRRQRRIDTLMDKYQDQTVVSGILRNEFWIGATEDMVRDSLGEPDDKDREVMKRKTKETWKFGRKQTNQYRLRVYLEDGRVTGWEEKS